MTVPPAQMVHAAYNKRFSLRAPKPAPLASMLHDKIRDLFSIHLVIMFYQLPRWSCGLLLKQLGFFGICLQLNCCSCYIYSIRLTLVFRHYAE